MVQWDLAEYHSSNESVNGDSVFRTSDTFELLGREKACKDYFMGDLHEEDRIDASKGWVDCAVSYLIGWLVKSQSSCLEKAKQNQVILWKSSHSKRIRKKQSSLSTVRENSRSVESDSRESRTTQTTSTETSQDASHDSSTISSQSNNKGKIISIPTLPHANRKTDGLEKVAQTCSSISASTLPHSTLTSSTLKDAQSLRVDVIDLTAYDDSVLNIRVADVPIATQRLPPKRPATDVNKTLESKATSILSMQLADVPVATPRLPPKRPSGGTNKRIDGKSETVKAASSERRSRVYNRRSTVKVARSRQARRMDPPDRTQAGLRYGSPEKARREYVGLPACPSSEPSDAAQGYTSPSSEPSDAAQVHTSTDFTSTEAESTAETQSIPSLQGEKLVNDIESAVSMKEEKVECQSKIREISTRSQRRLASSPEDYVNDHTPILAKIQSVDRSVSQYF